jgi:hypothetical protein
MKTLNLTANYVQMTNPSNDGKAVIEFGCGRFRLRLHITRSLISPLARVLHKFLAEEQSQMDSSRSAMRG